MSRNTKYNAQYPIHQKVSHGVLLAMDGIKIAQQFMVKLLELDVSPNKKVETAKMINLCIGDMYTVNKFIDVSQVRMRVNFFMAVNEFAPHDILSLVCSFIETILFQADDYRGFNNYRWSHGGSTTWHNDHPDMNDSNEAYQIASKAMRNEAYQSQEYHRIYY